MRELEEEVAGLEERARAAKECLHAVETDLAVSKVYECDGKLTRRMHSRTAMQLVPTGNSRRQRPFR